MEIVDKEVKHFIAIVTMTVMSCSSAHQSETMFNHLADQREVKIYLDEYNLSTVPPAVGALTQAQKLVIAQEYQRGWVIYPPQSAFDERINRPPFYELPHEITTLTNLHSLRLVGLSLKTLPDDFENLIHLDTLDLSLNKLTIADELDKLKQLKKLKYLNLFGNRFNPSDLDALRAGNPQLEIVPRSEELHY